MHGIVAKAIFFDPEKGWEVIQTQNGAMAVKAYLGKTTVVEFDEEADNVKVVRLEDNTNTIVSPEDCRLLADAILGMNMGWERDVADDKYYWNAELDILPISFEYPDLTIHSKKEPESVNIKLALAVVLYAWWGPLRDMLVTGSDDVGWTYEFQLFNERWMVSVSENMGLDRVEKL